MTRNIQLKLFLNFSENIIPGLIKIRHKRRENDLIKVKSDQSSNIYFTESDTPKGEFWKV